MIKPTQDVLTTGQVAKLCNVAPRTVSKWFDSGQLRGYRIPGSKDRRIPLDQLVRFMKAYGMPLNGLDGGLIRVLVADPDDEFATWVKQAILDHGRYEVETASCAFSAGVQAEKFKPHTVLIDPGGFALDAQRLCRCLRGNEDLQGIKLIALGDGLDHGLGQALIQQGFESYLEKPFDVPRLIRAVEEAVAIVA